MKIAHVGSPTRLFTRIIAKQHGHLILNRTKFSAALCTDLYNLLMIMMSVIGSLVHIILTVVFFV